MLCVQAQKPNLCQKTLERPCRLDPLYHIGLKDPDAGIDDDDIVGLESMDGVKFRVPRHVAYRMGETIKNLIEDAGTNDYIPLPNISTNVVELLVNFSTGNKTEKEIETTISRQETPLNLFLDFIVAANYLDGDNYYNFKI